MLSQKVFAQTTISGGYPQPTGTPFLTPFPVFSSTPQPTETPYLTPTPPQNTPSTSPSPTNLKESFDLSKVVSVFNEDSSRTLAEVWAVSWDNVVCSKDKTLSSDTFNLTETTYSLSPPTSSLYCISKGPANLGVSTSGNLTQSYSKVIPNIGKSSVHVLPENSGRSRALIQVVSGAAYCGYSCPANSSNGFLITPSSIIEFYGVNSICCSSVSDLTAITVASEIGGSK